MQLAGAPLTANRDDQRAYLEREADQVIGKAITNDFNVLLLAERGSGATSLLRRVEAQSDQTVYVDAGQATSPEQIVGALAARLSGGGRAMLERVTPNLDLLDPLSSDSLLRALRLGAERREVRPVVLLDGPGDPSLLFDLFGRRRDDVRGLGLTWLVVGFEHRASEYLTPPADAFFDVVVSLAPLTPDEGRELLTRRGVSGDDIDDELLVMTPVLTPRFLLAVTRRQVLNRAAQRDDKREAASSRLLSRGAEMLRAELQGRPTATATDLELQRRLGLTERSLRRHFDALEEHGAVERVPGTPLGTGRPPVTYRLTSAGQNVASGKRIA